MITKHVNTRTGKEFYMCHTDTHHRHRTFHAADRCVKAYLRKYGRK